LPKYPDVKVWNLSLSADAPCAVQEFSHLAMALDDLQDRYGVTFVLSAGNYKTPPLRGWPPGELHGRDRIAPPADSVRAITVGSLAHLEKPNSRVRRDQPSPFSRRGPGPVSTPKPEVVQYGGNCDSVLSYAQTGVMSLNADGQLAEDIGTSFTAPVVAALLSNVNDALSDPPSRSLAKALLVHSAVLNSPPVTADDLRYRGFGVPGSDLLTVLSCSPWAATLIFEAELVPGLEYERWPFPVPACLRSKGKFKGEIIMTAAYEPPVDANCGAEYCRANVDVSLGIYDETGKDGAREHKKRIPPEPKDMKKRYEKELIEHGFKWSPVKVYRRNMKQGIKGTDWRLKVTVNHRSGFESDEAQKFALVVTLRDPKQKQPVYDEVVALMRQQGWTTLDLEIRERVRSRG